MILKDGSGYCWQAGVWAGGLGPAADDFADLAGKMEVEGFGHTKCIRSGQAPIILSEELMLHARNVLESQRACKRISNSSTGRGGLQSLYHPQHDLVSLVSKY